MPTTRRRSARRSATARISREAVAAYKAKDEITLHRLLGLRPWMPSPLEVNDAPRAPSWVGDAWTEAWPRVVELRHLLEEAASE